jgi:CheY-like chemotaxis protein
MTVDDPVMAPELAIRPRKVQQRILIVDDDHSQAEVLAYRFGKEGYKTVTADNGKRGMQIAHDEHPDLILLDIRLPDVDGLTVCHELNDAPDTCDIPIIVLSAMERPDIIRRTRSAGSHFFLRKPYDPNALFMLAQAAMNDSQQLQ